MGEAGFHGSTSGSLSYLRLRRRRQRSVGEGHRAYEPAGRGRLAFFSVWAILRQNVSFQLSHPSTHISKGLALPVLRELHIEDFAIIDELHRALEPGLNILTGETGAGSNRTGQAAPILQTVSEPRLLPTVGPVLPSRP